MAIRLSSRWPKELGVRVLLALVFAGLGYTAVTQSLAMVVQKQSPGEAHELAPNNGFITSQLASKLSGPSATGPDRKRADKLARMALRQDPTTVDAAVVLGLNMQIHGDTEFARRPFAYAQALSRRNLQAQLWAIDDAVTRGDLRTILRHFDIALRTSPIASAILFPILTTAIVEPEIRAALAQAIAQKPAWANNFMGYIVGSGTNPETMASLFQAVSRLGGVIPDQDSSGVINLLVSASKFDQAWNYYASLHSSVSRRRSRDPEFRNSTEFPSPFDWIPINDGSVSAVIQPGADGGAVLVFAAPPSIGGQIVRQVEMLPPGKYELEGRSEGIDQSVDARPYWSLSCRNGPELGRADVPNSTIANGRFSGHFVVPADCPIQVLAFNVRPSSNISGVAGQIKRALLRSAR